MAALPLGSPSGSLASEESEFILALVLSHPPVPGLHRPDKPGAFLFKDLVALNQHQEPHSDDPVSRELQIVRGLSIEQTAPTGSMISATLQDLAP
jgi:hypothetical protein